MLKSRYDMAMELVGMYQETFYMAAWQREFKVCQECLDWVDYLNKFSGQFYRWIEKAFKILKWVGLPENRRCSRDRGGRDYQEFRFAVLDRDRWKCQDCGTKKKLHVHHIKDYKRHPELRIDVSNGIVLCKECHVKEHRYQRFN